MALHLQPVAAHQGWLWFRDGLALTLRQPFGFTLMLLIFLFTSTLVMLLPLAGVLGVAALPLLSLGFMNASRSVLAGSTARISHFIEPLRGAADIRRRLLLLCAVYGALMLAALWLAGWAYGDSLDRLREVMSTQDPASEEVLRAWTDPRLNHGMSVFMLLAGAVSVPFWHAPALVQWAGQGVSQALFSSTLSLWRAKAAYAVYLACWMAATLGLSLVFGLAAGMVGARAAIVPLMASAALLLSVAFYASLWFTYADSFERSDPPNSAPPPSDLDASAPPPVDSGH